MKGYNLLVKNIRQLIKDTEYEMQYRTKLYEDNNCENREFTKGQKDFAERYKFRLQEIILNQL